MEQINSHKMPVEGKIAKTWHSDYETVKEIHAWLDIYLPPSQLVRIEIKNIDTEDNSESRHSKILEGENE